MDNAMTITEVIPAYTNLKHIYTQVVGRHDISFADQCQLILFYNQYQGKIEDFDRMVVNLLMQKDSHTCGILINRLKTTINEIIKIYDQNKELLRACLKI
ncbi:MAG: hypothetical protein QM640_00580 [Niabella sp.]